MIAFSGGLSAMFVDGTQVASPMTYDLCIVGAGAAGITLAREFLGSNVSVGLLESGGLQADPGTQSLCEGETTEAIPSSLRYLTASRMRCFGGTTALWNGWTRPLDRLDFEPRNWIGNSGWPVTRAEMVPFYERAARHCEVPGFPAEGEQEKDLHLFKGRSLLVPRRFHISPPTRFGVAYRKELEGSGNVSVLLHSNATDLKLDRSGQYLKEVEVQALTGNRYSVKAKAYVIACGGIENPRLLLSSRGVQAAGLGNRFDVVGKYFMEHPHLVMAEAILPAATDLKAFFQFRIARALLAASEALQREKRILNFAVVLHEDAAPMTGEEAVLAARLLGTKTRHRKIRIELRIEQAPDAANRITLSDRKDRLGNLLPRLAWRMNPIDLETAREGLRIFANELGANSLGRVKDLVGNFERSSAEPSDPRAGWMALWHHQMGGTRMHISPRLGVVDAHCRVHGVANLFVAGSSVFPTSGFANPTLTIVALAARLADRLKSQLPELVVHG